LLNTAQKGIRNSRLSAEMKIFRRSKIRAFKNLLFCKLAGLRIKAKMEQQQLPPPGPKSWLPHIFRKNRHIWNGSEDSEREFVAFLLTPLAAGI